MAFMTNEETTDQTEEHVEPRQPPRFSGVVVHKDRLGRYSIRYPTDWDLFIYDGTDEGQHDGVTFRPNPDDPRTFFNVWVRELEQGVVAEDQSELSEGIRAGLEQLPGAAVESFVDFPMENSNLLKFEMVYSFREGDATLKRKAWVLFADRWQYMVTWQGSSPEEFGYWLAMANYCFASFELPQALMFATDREMIERFAKELGRGEQPTADDEPESAHGS